MCSAESYLELYQLHINRFLGGTALSLVQRLLCGRHMPDQTAVSSYLSKVRH